MIIMMGMKYGDILDCIEKEKGVAHEELQRRVQEKLTKLSGLISKEGAAHIVANELGVDIISIMKKGGIKIAQVMPSMRNVTLVGKVVKDYGLKTYQKEGRTGRVWSMLIGDESGTMRIVVWDETLLTKMEQGNINEGMVLRLSDGFVKDNNGYKEMHLGSKSVLELNPIGVSIGEVKTSSTPSAATKKISTLQEGDFARMVGTVVQMFEPKFYDGCGECGKKVDQGCQDHPGSTSLKVPILNFYLDDGSGNIPIVVFRDLVVSLLGIPLEQVIMLSQEPASFDKVKQDFLGKHLSITGRVQNNTLFNRLEMVARQAEEVQPEQLLAEFSDKNTS
jgi:hypothetical protein